MGRHIVFSSNRDGNDEIYVMKSDGTDQVRLTNNPLFDGHPAFSPDGTKIAFSRQIGTTLDIWVMNADGTNPIRLTTNSGSNSDPDWARDTEAPAPPVPTGVDPGVACEREPPTGVRHRGGGVDDTALHGRRTALGAAAAIGSAAGFETTGLQIEVADDSTTTVWATATDPSGNTSSCSSASVTYVEDSTAPDTAIDSGPSGTTNDDTPEFTFSASEAGATFECRIDNDAVHVLQLPVHLSPRCHEVPTRSPSGRPTPPRTPTRRPRPGASRLGDNRNRRRVSSRSRCHPGWGLSASHRLL